MNTTQIRLAAAADAEGIAALSRELIEHGLPWRWRPERVRHAIAHPEVNVAAIGPVGAPLAFGIMEYHDDEAHLVLFAVGAAHQRQGIGTALLAWLEDVARTAGAARIRVEARRGNEAARSFYNQHGYHERIIEHGMYDGQVDGIRLEKWLRSG